MDETPWQLRVLRTSIKKKDKLRLLDRSIPFDAGRKALDVGCAQGTLGYFLRRKGGLWVHTDVDLANLETARPLLRQGLVQTPPTAFPFRSGTFDLVTCLDYLEHVDDDRGCLAEVARLLRPGGALVLITPRTGRFHLLHRARAALGMGLDLYGHKREGYTLEGLRGMLGEAGFDVRRSARYSRFFSEASEMALNFLYLKVFARRRGGSLRDGRIKPSTGDDFAAQGKRLKLYRLVYPFVWLASRLDHALVLSKGYVLVVWAVKRGGPGSPRSCVQPKG